MFLRPIFLLWPSLVLPSLIAGLAAGLLGGAAEARPVVVELYTSQGCSSCPPADALLGQLTRRPDVLALSLPITYWDMLGWKDTLASKANTDRQKAYAAAMGRGGIYTPQIVVDGASDVVGSRADAVEKEIAAREADMRTVPVTLKIMPGELDVSVAAGPAAADATIWMLRIEPAATVKIASGENGGHTVTYRNVVRSVAAVGMWKGKAVTLELPRDSAAGAGDAYAVLVQEDGYGRIIGATPVEKVAVTRGR